MRELIGRLLFWFIKDELERWNIKNAHRRVKFYSNLFANCSTYLNGQDEGLENLYEKNG
jgi:hypothetical protein